MLTARRERPAADEIGQNEQAGEVDPEPDLRWRFRAARLAGARSMLSGRWLGAVRLQPVDHSKAEPDSAQNKHEERHVFRVDECMPPRERLRCKERCRHERLPLRCTKRAQSRYRK